jgi:GNAT superfamily N-acetyltransferase
LTPDHTRHIVLDGQRVGFVVLKRLSHVLRLNHLYIDPPAQRQGIGHQVLHRICDRPMRNSCRWNCVPSRAAPPTACTCATVL